MPSTRSQTTKQSHIDDFTTTSTAKSTDAPQNKLKDTSKKPTAAQLKAASGAEDKQDSKKRAAGTTTTARKETPQKRQKTTPPPKEEQAKEETETEHDDKPEDEDNETHSTTKITVNRAPVLTLFAACVTEFLHSHLSWQTCLSAGASIASLCAISKGRSIGAIDPPSQDKKTKQDKTSDDDDNEDEEEITVMHFPLHIKNGLVVDRSSKPKPGNEKTLESKFGEEEEHEARQVFRDCLQTWKGHEDELNKKAFGMYEKFRPDVAKGQRGWGRKGEMSLEEVEKVIRRS